MISPPVRMTLELSVLMKHTFLTLLILIIPEEAEMVPPHLKIEYKLLFAHVILHLVWQLFSQTQAWFHV